MTASFTYDMHPGRILFGPGTLDAVADEIARLGAKRALILSTPSQRADAQKLAAQIGPLAAGVFSEAAMHTPVAVTRDALAAFDAARADCLVSLGGGSTIGLGKAIAWRNDAPQIVVATTYAGSEVTPILGQTEDGIKTTVRDPKILPEVVIYDPALTLGLPVAMSVTSGLNAIAHAVEGVYARDRNPVTSLMAVEGVRALRDALPAIVSRPDDLAARSRALYGSWLCGSVLGAVGMSLHHKLCHTLGGSFDLPHAETHAIVLPHSAAYNANAAAQELQPLAQLFGGSIGGGLYDFARSLGAPLALRDLGLTSAQLDAAADLAVRNPYWNPRPVERDAVRALLQRAWEGTRPE
ncbi:MAG: maleylacetate reductase [Paraburkholderia tropica]|uniref:Maleylacetate reductase n=1 Tax=Paraburkholderia tropica TaxID=92647 RepID=A0ABX5MUY5_9BURK|nr:maleylacetate reductase [Paraburkholderia tropica]MBB6319010.1 maleylacetate reductase [Paraburkholderia tropica]MDE1138821.1 maleylacetate reductase [Paraburkholderia tropica]PXX18813.1 maleylacetate reductase [Paraburkholderia tropica]PZW87345.1 maleylacetate reductase [Paraburkholderia tropica]